MSITPAQTCGPLFGFAMTPAPVVKSVEEADPDAIVIEGSIFDGANETVGYGAFVELWDNNQVVRVRTLNGHYRTVMRKPEPITISEGTTIAPHFDVRVVMRGLALPLLTKMYFPDEATLNAQDPVYTTVDERYRERLVSKLGEKPKQYIFDIKLQGENESVFFTTT